MSDPAASRDVEAGAARRWAGRATGAVADQGLFSVANFGLNILLARWLAPEAYGAFAVAFSVLLLLGSLHQAVLVEPMMVFGAGRFGHRFPETLRTILRVHVVLAGGGGLVLAGGAFLAGAAGLDPGIASAVAGAGFAAPFIFLQWLLRRATYVEDRVSLAVAGGAAYLVLLLGGTIGLRAAGLLTPFSGFGMMGAASLLSGIGMLGPMLRGTGQGIPLGALTPHLVRYGRWSLAGSALAWAPTNLLLLVLPIVTSLAETAAYRAAYNLVLPVVLSTAALSGVLLPALTRRFRDGDPWWLLRRALTIFAVASSLYGGLLMVTGLPLLDLLYGGRYAYDRTFVVLLGLILLPETTWIVLATVFRAAERPDRVFWAALFGAATTATVGVALMISFGIRGAALAVIASAIVQVLTFVVLLRRGLERPPQGAEPDASPRSPSR